MGDQLISGFGAAWATVAVFVPKLLGFLLILFIGWLIAKGLSKAVGLLLTRTGFSRLVERSGLGGMLDRGKLNVAGLLQKLVFYFVMLIALQYAFGVFGENNAVSQLLSSIVAFLPRIAVAVILVIIAAAIGKAVRDVIMSSVGGRSYGSMLAKGAQYFILALGVIAALSQIGIAVAVTMPILITALAIIAGIAIVGLGGGAIKPMQQRWEHWLERADSEISATRAEKEASASTTGAVTRPATPGQRSGEHETRAGAHVGNVAQQPRTER